MSPASTSNTGATLARLREAQVRWADTPLRRRLSLVGSFRQLLARRAQAFADAAGRRPDETLIAEVLPLLEACRFLEQNADEILAPRTPGGVGRPLWLNSVHLEVRREPVGVVMVIGPSNYPLFLAAVQVLQALTAGNAVVLKPGRGASHVCALLAEELAAAGLDSDLLFVTTEDVESVYRVLDAGKIDKVFFTGSESAGRAVMARLAESAIPSVMELSGDDAVFVLPSADLDRVVKALRFGVNFNGGETCIAPKRVLAWQSVAGDLGHRIDEAGVAISITPVLSGEHAITEARRSGFALGASVFGRERDALELASRIHAGVVVINDIIVPTADPRLPFGGRGRSGFGVTRGPEGLLEMTVVKAISVRRSRWLPHLDRPPDGAVFRKYIYLVHRNPVMDGIRKLWKKAKGDQSK